MNEPAPQLHTWFTPGQRQLIALASSCLAALLLVWVIFLMVRELQIFVATFGHVIWPLTIAGILSVLLRPAVRSLEGNFHLGRIRAIILLYFLVAAICLALGAILLPLLASQLIELVQSVPDFIRRADHYLKETVSQYPDIHATLKSYLSEENLHRFAAAAAQHFQTVLAAAPTALQRASSTLRSLFEVAASVAVIPIYLFFLLETNHNLVNDLHQQLTFLRPNVRQDLVFLVSEFGAILVSFFRGQLLIGLIMGVLKAIGFTLIGVQGGLILGMAFGLLNVVPYLGTILGLIFILPIAYFQPAGGGVQLMFEALGVFTVVQLCEAYFITPKIMGKRTGLHPMVIILSIFFWGEALHGLLGMILAVPLTAFLVVVWRLLKTKYLPLYGAPAVGQRLP